MSKYLQEGVLVELPEDKGNHVHIMVRVRRNLCFHIHVTEDNKQYFKLANPEWDEENNNE